MVDYTLREPCQANGAICCGNLHGGFDLGRTELGVTAWAPREISEASTSAVTLRLKQTSPPSPQTTEGVRGTNRPRIDKIMRRQNAPKVILRGWRLSGLTRGNACTACCRICPRSTYIEK